MGDTISRQQALDLVRSVCHKVYKIHDTDAYPTRDAVLECDNEIRKALKKMEPAEPVRMKGKWIDSEPDRNSLRKSGMAFFCSNCHHSAGKHKHTTYKFCPWCGADMREEQT